MYLSASTMFSTCFTAEAPNRCTSLLLLLSPHASPHTKSKRLTIDIPLCFYYFQHMHRRVQKARSSRLMYHSASTFRMHIAPYKKQQADRCTSLLLLLLVARASSCTKSKRLLIDAPYNFYYFSYAPSTALKKQGDP
jgi:hypothetical protein